MSTVTIQITLDIEGDLDEQRLEAIENLASVMAVQAEDDLWSLGSPDVEDDNGPSEFVAKITATSAVVIR